MPGGIVSGIEKLRDDSVGQSLVVFQTIESETESRRKNVNLLEVHEVSKHFGGVQAVDKVSVELAEGEILGIIGPNGAGKPRSST